MKPIIAQSVRASARVKAVLIAIELDNQLCTQARKIDDISVDRHLASKMRALLA